jgi:hypothetical protein
MTEKKNDGMTEKKNAQNNNRVGQNDCTKRLERQWRGRGQNYNSKINPTIKKLNLQFIFKMFAIFIGLCYNTVVRLQRVTNTQRHALSHANISIGG